MTVENQIPYQTYTANGTDSSFALGFYVEDKANFIVKIDDTTISNNNYIYNNTTNSIMFNSAPTAGQIITIERNTSLDRAINYSTYNNTFRPETLNFDLDRIWRKLQELGVADQLLKIYTDRLHGDQKAYIDQKDTQLQNNINTLSTHVDQQDAQLQQNIDNLKIYVDLKDDELQAYLMEEIRKQGVALDQLDDYYNYLMQRLAQIAVDKGWEASFVVDASGKTQQEVNDAQALKNSQSISPKDFGAFGDGLSHKLSTMYATLAEAQVKYPFATSLDDEADWCALQAFLSACHNNVYSRADMGGDFVINKTVHFEGNFHKTNAIYGSVDLRVLEPVSLDYFLKWEGYFSQMLGSIRCYGYQSNAADARTRTCKNGVLLGIAGATGNVAQGCYINSVTADNLQGYAFVMGQNTHFSEVGFVRGGYSGSAVSSGATAAHQVTANWSGKTDALANQLSGNSTVTVDTLPPAQAAGLEIFGDNSNTYVVIDDELYTVYSVDRVNSTLQLVPQITTTATAGSLKYIYGGAAITIGNNSANTVFRRIQSIVCGIGLRLAALYGTQVLSFTSEFNGIGIATARRNSPNIGSAVVSSYFEGNSFDLCENWSHPAYQGLAVLQDTALAAGKTVSLYTFLTGGVRVSTLNYSKLNATVSIAGKRYSANDWHKVGYNVTDSIPMKIFPVNGQTTTVSCDEKLFSHYGKGSIIYCFQSPSTANGAPTGNIVLNAGAGQTINGGASVTYVGSDYQQPLMLVISRTAANTLKVNAINKAEKFATLVYDPPSIVAGATASTTVSLTGAVLGDIVVASVNRSLAGMNMWAYVSAVDTVTVVFKNETAAAIDLAPLTIKVKTV